MNRHLSPEGEATGRIHQVYEPADIRIHQIYGPTGSVLPTFKKLMDRETYLPLGNLLYTEGINFVNKGGAITPEKFLTGYKGIVFRYDAYYGSRYFYPRSENDQMTGFVRQHRRVLEDSSNCLFV